MYMYINCRYENAFTVSQFTCVGDVSMSSAFGCVCFTVLEDLSISEVCGFDSNCLIRSFTGIAFSKFSLLNYKLPILKNNLKLKKNQNFKSSFMSNTIKQGL